MHQYNTLVGTSQVFPLHLTSQAVKHPQHSPFHSVSFRPRGTRSPVRGGQLVLGPRVRGEISTGGHPVL